MVSFLLEEIERAFCAELVPRGTRPTGVRDYSWQENLMRIVSKWLAGLLLMVVYWPDFALLVPGAYLMLDSVYNTVAYRDSSPATFIVECGVGLIQVLRRPPANDERH